MTTPAKIFLGIASVGAVGGGVGYGMHALSKDEAVKNSLKDKLISEGFDTNVTEEEWTAIETAHKSSANKFNIPAGVTDSKEWLKNHCKKIIQKEEELNTDYGKAIQWCVKKEKIVAILKKENSEFRTLNVAGTIEESEKKLWKDKIEKLNLSENSAAKTALNVKLNESTDDAKIKEIQKQCGLVIETETIGEEFENKLTLAKKWCSVTKEG